MKQDGNWDSKSTMSGVSAYTDISIDPVIRMKAEKILEYQKDKINLSQLEVIREENESRALNSQNL